MAQQAEVEECEIKGIWPKSLLLNKAYATAFTCTKCDGVPLSCMNDAEGDIVCDKCAKDIEETTPNKTVQKMINKLKTKCMSTITTDDESKSEEQEGANVIITNISPDSCDWTGMIQEWPQHKAECPYLIIQCTICKKHKCPRKMMTDHIQQCPEATIICPNKPKSCGCSILRKNIDDHLNKDCEEKLLDCTNDDCKEQIARKDFDDHVENKCNSRIVSCPFAVYGCMVKGIKADGMEQHKETFKLDHLSNQMAHMVQQFESLKKKNEKLEEENGELKGKLEEMKQHALPKGTVVNWLGDFKKMPKGWEMYERTEREHRFVYKSDFDKNGVIYGIGCNYGKHEWQNPSKEGLIKLKTSTSMWSGSIHNLIGRGGSSTGLRDKENNYFIIDFVNIKINPTNYTLRHGYETCAFSLRDWTLSGSCDGINWEIIKKHEKDKGLEGRNYVTKTWRIENCSKYYQYFRIYMNGKDVSGGWYLHCCGFEIYGNVKSNHLLIRKSV